MLFLCLVLSIIINTTINAQSLQTTYTHSHFWDELYFDITALKDIKILSFDFMCWVSGSHSFQIYRLTAQNTGYTSYTGSSAGWTSVYASTVNCPSSQAIISVTLTTSVVVNANQRQAFWVDYYGLLGQRNTGLENTVYTSNADLSIYYGSARYQGNVINGELGCMEIYYRLVSESPTMIPTVMPTGVPTTTPTETPTVTPTNTPTKTPTESPSVSPSLTPTENPTVTPTLTPTVTPTVTPTTSPSVTPSVAPTQNPTGFPSMAPSKFPTMFPTVTPTLSPTILDDIENPGPGSAGFLAGIPGSQKSLWLGLVAGGIVCCFICAFFILVIAIKHRKTQRQLELANKTILSMTSMNSSHALPSTGNNVSTDADQRIAELQNQVQYLTSMQKQLMNQGPSFMKDPQYQEQHGYMANDAMMAAQVGYNEMNTDNNAAGEGGEMNNNYTGYDYNDNDNNYYDNNEMPLPPPPNVKNIETQGGNEFNDNYDDDINNDDINMYQETVGDNNGNYTGDMGNDDDIYGYQETNDQQ